MSNTSEEPQTGISDEQLPEDLQPTDDNPLAQPLPDDVEADLGEGKVADEMQESDEDADRG
jgi:hypothetical protein